MNDAHKGTSVGDLVGSLMSETGTLVRQEIDLASAEMTRKAHAAARDVGLLAAGGALAQAGVVALLFALVLALAPYVAMWASALVAGVVALVVGYAMASRALKALGEIDPVPRRAVSTLKRPTARGAVLEEQVR